MFALVDCNSFYASCEKIFRPDLTKKPVIVLSNNDGCVIARSPEAKKMGVAMGQPWFQVKNQYLKSDGIVFSSNYELYADISNRVMNILGEICPEIDIYSIDEAFLDLRTFEKNIDLVNFAFQCKNRIKDWVGIPVSIGIAPTKTLAKIANRIAKEDSRFQGVVILQNKRAINHYLKATPVEKIWGVGKRLSLKLKDLGVDNAFNLTQVRSRLIGDRFNVVLERTVRELKSQKCLDSNNIMEPKKQIMVSRSFGKSIRDKKVLTKNVVLGRLEDTAEFKKSIKPKESEDKSLADLGVSVRNINNNDAKNRSKLKTKKGVIITNINPNGPLGMLPITPGDAVIAVQNSKVQNTKDFQAKISKLIKSGKKSILLTIVDLNNSTRYIGVKIK